MAGWPIEAELEDELEGVDKGTLDVDVEVGP